ncbi:MAG: glycosyl hydrolase 53 family protein [Muribaculaceae bacterium]|nr:glycosyl hydrolase 53 family protein [Muribaculaceae bacterium]
MTKRLLLIISLLTFTCMAAWCGTQYAGGDISLLPKYEEKGAIYYNENGKRITDMLSYLKATGLNAMRVRLFVDPSKANAEDQGEGVCQDLPFVASLGQRIKAAGFKLLLDIHYSDTWTDPGQHSTPSSWTVQSALADSVYSYTERVLYTLIAAGATPDFIQVGNEVTYGMLWPTGHCYPNGTNYGNGTFEMFANYLKRGIQACREVCPNAKLVVHTEMSRASNVISFYNTLKDYTTDFDIIGLSYYPYWHGGTSVLDGLLTTLENSYPDKKIQIVETGYPHAYYPSGANYDLQSTWPATEAGQKDFASALVETLNAHHNVNGLYWWFPEANEYGISYVNHVTTDWYNCGWWDNQNGQVMDALFEVAKYADNSEDEPTDSASIYIVGGEGNWSLTEPLATMTYSGNGIYVDTLTISAPIYFVFADGGPENWNNDWTAFNANYRYGPTATTTVTTGATYSTAKRDNNYSYYFTGDGSDYLFTFDVDNLTFTLDRVGLLGDVNNDRQVNIQDVTILIDYLLGSTMTSFDTTNADVNQDKTINIADVTSLIDRLLAG